MVKIKVAASLLGVTPQTVRNWADAGRLSAVRHPINGYRLFRLEDINALMDKGCNENRSTGESLITEVGASAESVTISYKSELKSGLRTLQWPSGEKTTTAVPLHRKASYYDVDEYELDWLRQTSMPDVAPLARRVRVGDAFSGGGIFSLGVDEGLRAIGMAPVHAFGIDFESSAIQTFKENFPSSVALHEDVTSLANGHVGERETSEERKFIAMVGGGVDILLAGPPCQGHSDLNNHTRRRDPKNNLYFSTARLAQLLQPGFMIVENVPGVVHDRTGVVQRTTDSLLEQGYFVSSGLVDLRRLGVPQARKRFVLVASRKGRVDIEAAIELQESRLRPVSWALDDLKDSYDPESVYDSSASHSLENRRRIDYLFDKGVYELPNSERPACHRDKEHSYVSVYGRMWWDRPAPTITGGFGSTGQGRFVHPVFRRTLTPHEACRLQFIPDFFRFPDSIGRRAMQQIIGNAAPPKLSYAIVVGAAVQGVLL